MHGAVSPLLNIPSWHGTWLEKGTGTTLPLPLPLLFYYIFHRILLVMFVYEKWLDTTKPDFCCVYVFILDLLVVYKTHLIVFSCVQTFCIENVKSEVFLMLVWVWQLWENSLRLGWSLSTQVYIFQWVLLPSTIPQCCVAFTFNVYSRSSIACVCYFSYTVTYLMDCSVF